MEYLLCSIYFIVAAFAAGSANVLPAEQEAVYLALESINSGVEWRTLYPDDICLSGPHGIACDVFSDDVHGFTPHITELNFGYLSEFNSNPDCSPNASLPTQLSYLTFLRRLLFYRCFRYGQTTISDVFWNMFPSLEELVIHDNPSLVGGLSVGISRLSRLRRFIISGTRISGVIPSEMGQLRNLEQLMLSRNRLQGSIPSTIGNLPMLKLLDLNSNRLVGSIPLDVGQLAELVKLDLSRNRSSGPVPAEFAMLKRLEFLDLSHNCFTGGVPNVLAEMQSLKEVYLNNNPFGGGIPEIWENLGCILGLGLSRLGLIGDIPPSMGIYLQNICYLSLEGNFLQGRMPEQLRLLERNAKEINIENNALHGPVPFSATFIAVIGGKLKLACNAKLCLDEDVAARVRGSHIGRLPCNKTEIPRPIGFFPTSFSPKAAFHLTISVMSFFFLLL